MAFKHGRLGEIWLNGVDVSPYFSTADFSVKAPGAPVDTFKNTYHAYIPGVLEATLTAAGYYDSADADKVRDTLEVIGQATYLPAGGVAIGDQARLLNIVTTDYKNGSKISGANAVTMDWAVNATAPIGFGTCLHTLKSENVGTVTGPGDGLLTSTANTTGLVAHLHVTAMTGGDTHNFKLQDCTTINGVYADIAGGAFTNVTATGSQRLVVTGTIRQFVQLVATINGHAATYACAAART